MRLRTLVRHAWVILPVAMIVDLIMPLALRPFAPHFRLRTMLASELAGPQSPVEWVARIWLILFGLTVIAAVIAGYAKLAQLEVRAGRVITSLVALFGLGMVVEGCNAYDSYHAAAKSTIVHSMAGSLGYVFLFGATGFLLTLSNRLGWRRERNLFAGCLVVGFLTFILSLYSTPGGGWILGSFGLWQRLNSLAAYLPMIYLGLVRLRERRAQAPVVEQFPQRTENLHDLAS